MESKFNHSDLWKSLEEQLFTDIDTIDLNSFRMPGELNNRLASWDPYDSRSYRYYLNILYNLATSMPEEFFDYYAKIGESNLGNPLSIKYNSLMINMDYLFSCQEILFMQDVLPVQKNICEIGVGFGRTCHAIVNNFAQIENYYIIDLPGCLGLSHRYLKEVLNEKEFAKIHFIPYPDAGSIDLIDLYINIDSMAEMRQGVVLNYLDIIDSTGKYFYSRNPICKYNAERIGLKPLNSAQRKSAMNTGLCKEVIDIFDEDALKSAKDNYCQKYSPSKKWRILKDEASLPWQYYHHVLYRNLNI